MKIKNILIAFTLLGSLTSLLAQSSFDTQEKKTALSALKDAKQSQQKKIQTTTQPVMKKYDSYDSYDSKELQSYKNNNSGQMQVKIPTH
ncbi:MAG: hypothetical protein PHX13_01400 [Thiovulaceae bacterium]|nr:hypothetical protein [Sulfurimonadaceae bacterium]